MNTRHGRGHDHDPFGQSGDRSRDRARQFGARDGEAGSWGERRYPEPEVFDAEHDYRRFDPDADRSQWQPSRTFGPRYERDEGYDDGRGDPRGPRGPARRESPASFERPASFLDAYRNDDPYTYPHGVERGRWGGPTPPYDVPIRRGSDPFAGRDRAYAHQLTGVPGYEAAHGIDGWNRWRGRDDASRVEASTHPSPYTDHIGPIARRQGARLHPEPRVEEERGWSGYRSEHTGELGGRWRNPAWEVPFRGEARETWGDHRPHLGKGPRGYVRSDERIREEVCDCLSDGYVDASQVEVDVKAGVVMLTGQVADKGTKRRIEDIADACRGVQSVDNQIRVQRVAQRGGTSSSFGAGTSDAVSSPSQPGDGRRGADKSVS